MMHDILDIIRNALLITGLVMVMMLIIEYVNVISEGRKLQNLRESRTKQVFIACLLGLIPGCIGGFAVVSLFTHGIVNFGALAAAMIVSLGDEAFILFATIPKTAIIITVILFLLGLITGFIVNLFVKKSTQPVYENHFEVHSHEIENVNGKLLENLKNITFQRVILITGIILFILGLVSGLLDHSHETHTDECVHVHSTNYLFNERWINILFAVVSLVTLYIIAKVNDHFLDEHLWGHIIKKHFLKIFLWTLGALFAIHFLLNFVDINSWTNDNRIYILLIALLVGIIPESGPHILFIVLFMHGSIPLSVLLANSIVQDGHSTLPLLAESKKSFFYIKLMKIAIGAIIGFAGILMGF